MIERMIAGLVLWVAAGLPAFASRADDATAYRQQEAACFAHRTRACFVRLEQRCIALRGDWGGHLSGRGRMPGCNVPTRDGGEACRTHEQCESACVDAGPAVAAPGAQSPASPQCRCYPMQRLPKGTPLRLCTKRGIESIHID